jgi:hypothetical protein
MNGEDDKRNELDEPRAQAEHNNNMSQRQCRKQKNRCN